MHLLRHLACLGLFWCLAGTTAHANTPSQISAICDAAITHAAQQTGVPTSVLRAITLTETGRRIDGAHKPWPWTVNMEGKGVWFGTREEALAYVKQHFDRGARSFDVGCFQINYRWHGNAFASIEDMFDPRQNAAYAGRFLSDLYRESRSWSKSAGAYHSRTPQYANRYRARFDRILARLTGKPLPKQQADEYDANLQAGEALLAEVPSGVKEPEPVPEIEVPWDPPPPTRFGSLAGLQSSTQGRSLLIRPSGGLF